MKEKDPLGTRMKEFYENRYRFMLSRRTFTIIRLDGKSFSKYTKGLKKPFDYGLIEDMNNTVVYLCENIQGVKFGYCQSDEITLVLTDFDTLKTDLWFDGNIQKMASISASLATAKFNQLRYIRSFNTIIPFPNPLDVLDKSKLACFDSRVFQIAYIDEVINAVLWRQRDCVKNSISSVAQSLYSHKELEGVNSDQKQELIFQKGLNWNNYTSREKRGGFIKKVQKTLTNKDGVEFTRNKWECVECPDFSKDSSELRELLTIEINK